MFTIPVCQRGSGVLLQDNFVDTNGTLLTAHTMNTGPGWTLRSGSGTFTINSNTAQTSGTASGEPYWFATSNAGQSNYSLYLTLSCYNFGYDNGAAIVRYNASNGTAYMASLESAGLKLYSYNSGTFTQLAIYSFTPTAATNYTIEVQCYGSTITVLLNGTTQITYSSATINPTSTLCGMRAYTNSASTHTTTFSNFKVTA